MSIPTDQHTWNRHVHISNAFGEHFDLTQWVVMVDVTPESGAAIISVYTTPEPAVYVAQHVERLTPEQAGSYPHCQQRFKALAQTLR